MNMAPTRQAGVYAIFVRDSSAKEFAGRLLGGLKPPKLMEFLQNRPQSLPLFPKLPFVRIMRRRQGMPMVRKSGRAVNRVA